MNLILGEKQKMVNLRKAAAKLQRATSYDGTSFSSKKIRISPSNEPMASPAIQFRNGDVDSQNKTERNCLALCFGKKRRKRRRLQFAGAGNNGSGGTEVTYRGNLLPVYQNTPVSRQFTATNQG